MATVNIQTKQDNQRAQVARTKNSIARTRAISAANDANQSAIVRQRTLKQTSESEAVTRAQIAALRANAANAHPASKTPDVRAAKNISTVANPILSIYIWAYAAQFLFATFFIIAAGAGMLMEQLADESWLAYIATSILNLVPTGVLLGVGWIGAAGIGLTFLLATAIPLTGFGLKNDWSWRLLVIFAALQAAPFFFLLPWPAIWIAAILYLEVFQRDSHSS